MIAVSEGRAAGVVAEEDQGLAAVHRGLVGHRVAAVVPDSVLHTLLYLPGKNCQHVFSIKYLDTDNLLSSLERPHQEKQLFLFSLFCLIIDSEM